MRIKARLLARLVVVVVHEVGADVVPCEEVSSSVYKQLQKFSTLHHQSVLPLLCVISSIQYLQSFDPKYKCRRMLSVS
jgi:hypothetical protein